MSSIIDRLRGRNPEKEKKVKEDADAAAAKYERATGSSPTEERGLEEASYLGFLDPFEAAPEKYAGYKIGSVSGPKGGKVSYISRLREMGVPEKAIEAAAQDARMGRSVNIFQNRAPGVLKETHGEMSGLGEELKEYGKKLSKEKESDAPVITYGKSGPVSNTADKPISGKKPRKVSGEALEYLKRTGVDPTRKSAVDAMAELRKRNKT